MCATKFGTHDFDCPKCASAAASRREEACKQVEECLEELEKYGCAQEPEFCRKSQEAKTMLEMLDDLDTDSWYECIMRDFNDMADTDSGKIRAYDNLIESAINRLRKYFDSRIDEL